MDRVKGVGGLALAALGSDGGPLQANEGVTLVDRNQPSHTLLARYHASTAALLPLQRAGKTRNGRIQARNREQTFALDLLLDPDVPLVTLVGMAGTGKTLLALAAGLNQVADERLYDRLLVTRPVIPLGRDMGYLPGDLQEKMGPWMQPIIDNLDYLLGADEPSGSRSNQRPPRNSWADLKGMGLLEVEAISYIRGRSIPRQYMVVDEAHFIKNLSSQRSKHVLALADRICQRTPGGNPLRIALTGTPLINDIDDFRAIWRFLGWLDVDAPASELMAKLEATGLTPADKDFYAAARSAVVSMGIVRRRKIDVAKDLPAKRVVRLPAARGRARAQCPACSQDPHALCPAPGALRPPKQNASAA
jgi:hypothetical protein